MPLLTVWAIRWRDLIYTPDQLKGLSWNFICPNDIMLLSFKERIKLLIANPIKFWLFWMFYYVVFFYIGCNGLIKDPEKRYSSGLKDFQALTKNLQHIIGNPEEHTKVKYLFLHFTFLVVSIPISWFCYHNFWFNTAYALFMFIFLTWNAGRKQNKELEQIVREKIKIE